MNLPAGTVTFLFTDIEGSTVLWQAQPRLMRQALARHDEILRLVIEAHRGQIFKTMGDAFCAAFASATDALGAAVDAQLALKAEPWSDETVIRVRMALHTGEARPQGDDYFGSFLSCVARVLSAGHGGQTLATAGTIDLIRAELPARLYLTELGEHRLKDLSQPQELFQVNHPDLPAEFPQIRSLRSSTHNLPLQLSPLVGRADVIVAIGKRLTETRLLTLTGAGGSGKTRLSLHLAAEVIDDYSAGAWLVDLAPLSDPALVPQATATVLGVREEPGRTLTQSLVERLRDAQMLLLLDNCEHVIDAAASLVETLLRSCPKLKILATSREALRLNGEMVYAVPALSAPERNAPSTPDDLARYDSVRLFVDRAVAASQTFVYGSGNARAVAQVCRRLDGIPLALELAAARVKMLSVEQVAQRLDDRFRLLTSGSRTALPRQQTLLATIDWSYSLLTEDQRLLLRRLSVFSGGWRLEAAEAVCGVDGVEAWQVLDLLNDLVEKSLVQVQAADSRARYRLLETLRQYGQERLAASDEAAALRACHRDYFLALAEEARPHLTGSDQEAWLARLDEEHDNLRAALAWSRTTPGAEEAGLRLACAIWRFWDKRGYVSEGKEHLRAALAAACDAPSSVCAEALHALGIFAMHQSEYTEACSFFDESLAICRTIDDQAGVATALTSLGLVATERGDLTAARALLDESLTVRRNLRDRRGIATTLINLARVADSEGRHADARLCYDECLPICRTLGDPWLLGWALGNSGQTAVALGELAAAERLYTESLTILRDLGDKRGIAQGCYNLASVLIARGEPGPARPLLAEALSLYCELGNKRGVAFMLELIAQVVRERGQQPEAVRLYAAADAQRVRISCPVELSDRQTMDRTLAVLLTALGESGFAAAWDSGAALNDDDAVTMAVEVMKG